ncbi:hypothetical protein BASA60_005334 [Batrachochytrium salamandrivorans]|nr:hypothetical protein BASA60_005334 [Batrachochytrium salamandrivorans]
MLWYILIILLQSQLLWTWLFGLITAFLKDVRSNDYFIRDPSSSYSSATPTISRFRNQQQQHRFFEPKQAAVPNQYGSFINPPPARPTPKSSDDMDIDFIRRGPLSPMERESRMKQGLCLVCGGAGHRKANCPKSRFNSDALRNIRAIQTDEINVPIKLRLADGDSSSMITHRTLPLQLHIGRHVETIGFYVTSLCHGIILGTWKASKNLGYLAQDSIPEPEPSDQTSDSAVDSDIDSSLFKDPSMDLDLGVKKPVLRVTNGTSKSVSFAETIQAKSTRSWKHLPVSKTPIPSEIDKEFSSVFSESQADILPSHRSFDCTIKPLIFCRAFIRKDYQLTREEDKVMQEWIADNLAKGFIRNSSSPYGAPCFFVKQKDKLRLCMDYRGLNKQTLRIEIQSR